MSLEKMRHWSLHIFMAVIRKIFNLVLLTVGTAVAAPAAAAPVADSVAVADNYQQADTGTKMIHLGKNTRSTIVSKGISAGHSQNSYRGLVKVSPKAEGARNHSQCDSLLLSSTCGAHTFPYADIQNETAVVEHEATTSKISEEQLFYCQQRGISVEEAVGLIVNGYAREVMNKLPMEFAVEAQKLLCSTCT